MTTHAHSIIGHDRDGNRPEHDFYPTPPEAVYSLLGQYPLDYWGERILEPCAGDGVICRALAKTLDKPTYIYAIDIEPRQENIKEANFLSNPACLSFPCPTPNSIITNPPFKLAQEFIEESLHRTRGKNGKVAMLCRLNFLEGQKRKVFFENTPLSKVHVFSWRVPMWRNGIPEGKGKGKMMAYAWFVWDWNHQGEPVLDWL